jgi:acyl carrier protein
MSDPLNNVVASAIAARVLEIVAEQTGYPAGLLDIALELEADLGIDSVKQAEVLATIREAYGIERDDKFQFRDYPHRKFWRKEEIRLLGTAPDAEIARRLGRTPSSVKAQRRFRRIQAGVTIDTNPPPA